MFETDWSLFNLGKDHLNRPDPAAAETAAEFEVRPDSAQMTQDQLEEEQRHREEADRQREEAQARIEGALQRLLDQGMSEADARGILGLD